MLYSASRTRMEKCCTKKRCKYARQTDGIAICILTDMHSHIITNSHIVRTSVHIAKANIFLDYAPNVAPPLRSTTTSARIWPHSAAAATASHRPDRELFPRRTFASNQTKRAYDDGWRKIEEKRSREKCSSRRRGGRHFI